MLVLFSLELRTVMRHCLLTFLHVTFVTKHLRRIVMSRSIEDATLRASISAISVAKNIKLPGIETST